MSLFCLKSMPAAWKDAIQYIIITLSPTGGTTRFYCTAAAEGDVPGTFPEDVTKVPLIIFSVRHMLVANVVSKMDVTEVPLVNQISA